MGFFEFSHTRTYDSDLGWLIWAMRKLIGDMEEFTNLNSIKFADPINWTIDRNYESSMIVLDENGNGYIARKPVPAGVPLSNTDYWTQIFNFGDLVDNIRDSIAILNFKESPTVQSAVLTGNLFWSNGNLYVATTDMQSGTAILPGVNADLTTIEEWVKDRLRSIGENITDITTELNALSSGLNTVLEKMNNSKYLNVKDIGAVGDGVTDDTQAFRTALSMTEYAGIIIPRGTYLISDVLDVMRGDYTILGYGAKLLKRDYEANHVMIRLYPPAVGNINLNNVSIYGLEIDGNKPITAAYSGVNAPLIAAYSGNDNQIYYLRIVDCYLHNNIGRGIGLDGGTEKWVPRVRWAVIENCKIQYTKLNITQSIASSTIIGCWLSNSHLESITVDNGCLDCKIIGNSILNHEGGTGGIGIDAARELIIADNYINGYSTAPIETGGYGISINSNIDVSRNVIISNNILTNNLGYGVRTRKTVYNPMQACQILGNIFMGNAQGEIYIDGAEGKNKIDNNIYRNANGVVLSDIALLQYIYQSDFPIQIPLESIIQTGWSADDANHCRCFYLNNYITLVGRYRKAAGAANLAFSFPAYIKPAYAWMDYSSIQGSYMTSNGNLNIGGVPDNGTVVIKYHFPIHL